MLKYQVRNENFVIHESEIIISAFFYFKFHDTFNEEATEEKGICSVVDNKFVSNKEPSELLKLISFYSGSSYTCIKYIIYYDKHSRKYKIIIFSPNFKHDEICEFFGLRKINAGFINSNLECYGRSDSLKLNSNPEIDTEILRSVNSTSNIITDEN